MEIKIIGKMDHTIDHTFESANRVYGKDGICPTIPTNAGGDHMPKIIDCVAMRGGNPENPSDRKKGIELEQRLEVKEKDCIGTITTVQKDNLILERKSTETLGEWTWEIDGEVYLIRIRKLTPRECWRLMGFTDEDFNKAQSVNSNTQLYKQAGNSIVVNCLESIFRQML